MSWKDDDELFKIIKAELFSAVVGDSIMDKLGYLHQFLPPQIRPLHDRIVVVGRAMPVLETNAFDEVSSSGKNPVMSQPFGLMLEALDSLKRNEAYVCTEFSPNYALWGGLMSARALQCGAVGAMLDGYSRVTHGILALDFPTSPMANMPRTRAQGGRDRLWFSH